MLTRFGTCQHPHLTMSAGAYARALVENNGDFMSAQKNNKRARATRSKNPPTRHARTSVPPSASKRRPTSRHERERGKRKARRLLSIAGAVVVVALVALLAATQGGSGSNQSSGTDIATAAVSGPAGPEGVPLEEGTLLASASTASTGNTVDGISCDAREQVAYHVHTHLSVYVDGTLRPLPAGIGIVAPLPEATAEGPFDSASHCYYWLHVHAQDGVIHIESPTQRSYTLGQFFDIWRQPLGSRQIASASGKLTVFVNGRIYRANPRDIQLGSHLDIQIDVGSPIVAPRKVDWADTQL
jgi:hypothetical protein